MTHEWDISHVSCAGYADATATLNVSGGVGPYEVVWMNIQGATGMTQTGLAPGAHSVQVTDTGAGGIGTFFTQCIIEEPTPLNSFFDNETFANCSGDCDGTATMFIEGGTPPYSFDWPSEAVVSADGMSGTNLCPGTTVVTITDANECQSFAVLLIEQPENVVFVSTTPTDVSCDGNGNDGTATVEAFNGSPPYTYLWESGETTPSISNLPVGTYTCAVTDAIGCTTESSVVVAMAGAMSSVTETVDVSCFGAADGSVNPIIIGGTPPFSYDYSGADPTALAAGTYTVVVTDANSCTYSEDFTIVEPTELILTVDVIDETCTGCPDFTATPIISGGIEPFTYDWGGADPNNLASGSYEVTVTDANNCSSSVAFEIEGPEEEVSSDIESVSDKSMILYPNPVKDLATLTLPQSFEGQTSTIRLIDVSGKVQWTDQNASAKYVFQKGNTTPGIYILEAISESGRAHIKLILE